MSNTDLERVRLEQREFWNNAAPGWKRMWTTLERAAQHVSDRLVELAGIKNGDRVLDLATGSGEPAITAARKVGPHGLVVATDHAPAMLALARERASVLGLRNVKFVETDAETLALQDRDFNAALCRWGLMFVPSLERAALRLAQLLIPGGTLATAVWGAADRVPMISLGDEAVRELTGLPQLPVDAPHPLKLANTEPLERALKAAGFTGLRIEPIIVSFEWDSADAFTEQRRSASPQFRSLLSRQTPQLQQRIIETVTNAARGFADSSGKVKMDNEAICVAARR
jgi:enediyne biosynthesis protein CalE5